MDQLERFIGEAKRHYPDACYLLYFAYWEGPKRAGRGFDIAIPPDGSDDWKDVWEKGTFAVLPQGAMCLYELPETAWDHDDDDAGIEQLFDKVKNAVHVMSAAQALPSDESTGGEQ